MESTFLYLGGIKMDTRELDSLDLCRTCLDSCTNFVLQGGAGSGKTESLKDLLLYISKTNPQARVICITHTNVAVQEIQERIGDIYPVSTIHSFLYCLIKNYKKNIKDVIPILYTVSKIEHQDYDETIDEKEYKKAEHERYKKKFGKYADKLFAVKRESCEKAVGKREYDKNPSEYNEALNTRIDSINCHIVELIKDVDYSKIHYNETKFDSLKDVTYGHDGLLILAHLLFEKYPVLRKIVRDKYNYIFIDEYQDTKSDVIRDFLKIAVVDVEKKLTLCLFGDSMQAIFSDGIGSVEEHIKNETLVSISKADNFRCAYEVIDIINNLRLDNIKQKVALAKLPTGEYETDENRHGNVKILYAICTERPNSHSSPEKKAEYSQKIDKLIAEAKKHCDSAKLLMLTNKAIAEKEGFKNLYKVFDDRYVEVNDRLDNYLKLIQIIDICDICQYYIAKTYNPIIKSIKAGGYIIHSIKDKITLQEIIEKLINDKDISIYEAYEYATEHQLIKQTEACQNVLNSNVKFKEELANDPKYQLFKNMYLGGKNTYNRIKDEIDIASEEEFDYYKNLYKKGSFINTLFSKSVKFSDALNYTKYLNEDSEYITMHKTKGSSIDSVIVVMEEFYWNEYDFLLLFSSNDSKKEKRENSQKLIYVACSRARKSLICIKLLLAEEVVGFKRVFPIAEEIVLK